MANYSLYLFLALAGVLAFFVLIGFPAWALFDALTDIERTPNCKFTWATAIFVLWFPGAIAYGFITRNRLGLRLSAWVIAIFLAASTVFCIRYNYKGISEVDRLLVWEKDQLPRLDFESKEGDPRAYLQSALDQLRHDAGEHGPLRNSRFHRLKTLADNLKWAIADNILSASEWSRWKKGYEGRVALSDEYFFMVSTNFPAQATASTVLPIFPRKRQQ